MTLEDWLIQAFEERGDARKLTLFAAADFCEDAGKPAWSHCLRWMAARGKWPMTQKKRLAKHPWAAWRGEQEWRVMAAALASVFGDDAPGPEPEWVVPDSVLAALRRRARGASSVIRYRGPHALAEAVTDLADALTALRRDVAVGPPEA